MTSLRLVLTLLLVGLCSTGHAEPLPTLRLVVTHTAPPLVPNSVLDLADSLGFYRREGLAVEFVRVQHTPMAIVALRNGYADLGHVSVSAMLHLTAQGRTGLKAVLAPDHAIPFLIAARREIATVTDLHGRTLAIGGVGSVDDSMTRSVLSALGAKPDEVKTVAIGEPRLRAQALASGTVDATTISVGAWLRFRQRPDLHVLVDPDAFFAAAPGIDKVIAGEGQVLHAKRDLVTRFVRALVAASRAFAADPQLWVKGMQAARPDVALDDLQELARAYRWQTDGGLDEPLLARTLDRLYAHADFRDLRRVSATELLEKGPLDDALAQLGTPQLKSGHSP